MKIPRFILFSRRCVIELPRVHNGMTAEQFVWAWIKSQFLMPKKILFVPENLYYEAMKQALDAHERGLPVVQDKKRRKRKRRKKRTKTDRRKQPKKSRKRKEVDHD